MAGAAYVDSGLELVHDLGQVVEQPLAVAPLLRPEPLVDRAPAPSDLGLLAPDAVPTGVGQGHQYAPAVAVAAPALHEPRAFETVNEPGGCRGRYPGSLGQLPQGPPSIASELGE